MTREELLEKLYEIKNWKCNGDSELYEIIKEVISALEAQKWIPCKERLPKKDGSYLVSGKWAGGKYRSGEESVGECEYSRHDGYFKTSWNFDVLAWKNLPEPYREEGNEQTR